MDHQQETLETYNKTVANYKARISDHFYTDEFYFYKEIVQGKKIIDLGCGTGRDAKVFTENGFDYTGIDNSSEMLKIAKQDCPSATFLTADFMKIPFMDNSFDGFWAAASIVHLPRKDLP